MAIDWPIGPTVGQLYTSPNGDTWQWIGYAWKTVGSGFAVGPTGPPGDFNYAGVTGATYDMGNDAPSSIKSVYGVTYTQSGPVSITTPSLAAMGGTVAEFTVVDEGLNANVNNITLVAGASTSIGGTSSYLINKKGMSLTFYYNGNGGYFLK